MDDSSTASEVLEGEVKWFNDAKGYGFIAHNRHEYFVHFKAILCDGFKTLREGDKVKFKSLQGKRGLEARDVILVR